MLGTIMEAVEAFDALSGAKGAVIALALGALVWRWMVHRDRATASEAVVRGDKTSAEIAAVKSDVRLLSGQVQNCATKDDLRRTDDGLAQLKIEVRVNEARVIEKIDGVSKRIDGATQTLDRIEEHLLRSKA